MCMCNAVIALVFDLLIYRLFNIQLAQYFSFLTAVSGFCDDKLYKDRNNHQVTQITHQFYVLIFDAINNNNTCSHEQVNYQLCRLSDEW